MVSVNAEAEIPAAHFVSVITPTNNGWEQASFENARLMAVFKLYEAFLMLNPGVPPEWKDKRQELGGVEAVWSYLLAQLRLPMEQQDRAFRRLLTWLALCV